MFFFANYFNFDIKIERSKIYFSLKLALKKIIKFAQFEYRPKTHNYASRSKRLVTEPGNF